MAKFSIFAEPPEFKPRPRLGVSPDLPQQERVLLDALDVMEQKQDYTMGIAMRAHNLVVVVILVGIVLEGPRIVGVLQNWIGGAAPHVAVITRALVSML